MPRGPAAGSMVEEFRRVAREKALETLNSHGGHYGRAAAALGIAQSTLYKWARDWRKAGFLR